MTPFQNRLKSVSRPYDLPAPANSNADDAAEKKVAREHGILSWLFRATSAKTKTSLATPQDGERRTSAKAPSPVVPLTYDNSASLEQGRRYLASRAKETLDDWQTVTTLCGHSAEDFTEVGVGLPLSGAEIDHFRRNHRETDHLISRDFLTSKSNLPSPLAELYGLYRHRARLDTESALFVAQTTGSTRVARIVADLLAIGGFANGHESIAHISMTYSVPAAFDTSEIIDKANAEAERRLALPVEHPAHLLKLSPDEISVLAANIVERHVMPAADFLDKSHRLAEARQDVTRLTPLKRFTTCLKENDIPLDSPWLPRLVEAYKRIFKIGVGEN